VSPETKPVVGVEEITYAAVVGVTETAGEDAVPLPAAFTARSLMLYVVPLVRPETVTGEGVPASVSAQVVPLFVEYWYFVIAEPPSEPAVKAIDAEALLGVATNEVGAAGVVTGVTATAADEAP
jgi:hypothetical protein